ncbi:hypothetical protein WS86_11500 [Burkholderia savannae]|nr:hypothetical protein WS86_11500 [Burkholderia savannae]
MLPLLLQRNAKGEYDNPRCEGAWEIWQASAAASPAAAIPQPVLDALRFYANGHHFNIDRDHQDFDTVSDEAVNWLFSERDDDCTMIEDGSIAKAALCGGVLGFEEPEAPLEGEVFTAALQPAQAGAQAETREPARHEWDATGERCVKCGDKDWFADPHCSESRIKGSAPADAVEAVGIVHRPARNGADFSVEWLRSPPGGAKLYTAPPAARVASLTDEHQSVIRALIDLLAAVETAFDDSEERGGTKERHHVIDAYSFDAVCGELDKLDELPNDKPGEELDAAGKAKWALRAILNGGDHADQA